MIERGHDGLKTILYKKVKSGYMTINICCIKVNSNTF